MTRLRDTVSDTSPDDPTVPGPPAADGSCTVSAPADDSLQDAAIARLAAVVNYASLPSAVRRHRPIVAGAVEGVTLQQWASEKRPTARQCAEMIARGAGAVASAPDHSAIHRGIRLENVRIDGQTGEPILTDVELSKEIAAQQPDAMGPAADVYALGAMLYELLCGQPPYMRKVQSDAVVPLRKRAPRVDPDLETVCMKALAEEPNERYPTARALSEELDRIIGEEAILARREGIGRKAMRLLRRAIHAGLHRAVV